MLTPIAGLAEQIWNCQPVGVQQHDDTSDRRARLAPVDIPKWRYENAFQILGILRITCQHAESCEGPPPGLSPTHSSLQACTHSGKILPQQGDASANITAGAPAYGPAKERAKRADTVRHRQESA